MSRRALNASSPASPPSREWLAPIGLALALLAVTLLAYAPAIRADFIWNDSDYVTAPSLQSVDGLARIWFEFGATEQYYPLLHSAFWLEHRLWGESPTGYHLINIFLHAGSAWLLAGLLRRLAIPGAVLAAFVFALHPVYVESVAWISEEKNTLSLVFYLLAALAYLRFDADRRPRDYVIATTCFLAALLSKTTTATLPAALLVVFWWKRGLLEWKRDGRPLLPWFVLGAAMGLLSAWVEKKYIGAEGSEFALTLLQRALLAGRIVWFYLGKLFWPSDLIFIYPRWKVDPAQLWQWWFFLGAIAAIVGLWLIRRRSRAPLAAVLFFGGSLFPTLGFFNVYGFLFSFVADHWQYLPSIGLLVLACAALAQLRARLRASAFAGALAAMPIVLVGGLGVLSYHQSRMYADMRTFYRATLARNPTAWMAHNNLGNLLRDDGDLEGAITHFKAALEVRPDLAKAHNNLATALRDRRQTAEAIAEYRRALAIDSHYMDAHNNLGSLLRETHQLDEALQHLAEAVRLAPTRVDARNNFGVALRDAGRSAEAIAQFRRAVEIDPNFAAAHLNLALSYSLLGREAESMEHYRIARRLNPAIPELPGSR